MELENLVTLIQTVSQSDLTGFQYEENGFKLKIQKEKTAALAAGTVTVQTEECLEHAVQPANGTAKEGEVPPATPGNVVRSPLVGTFYAAPSEDAAPFVSVGDSVKKGQVIAIVEAMKLMNDIESEFDGTVTEILVKNGEAVEYGQPLFCIE